MPALHDIKGLRPIHYRVVWWMLAKGGAGGALVRGWMGMCAGELGVHRITINRAMRVLRKKGLARELARGTFELALEHFTVDEDSKVKIRKARAHANPAG